MSKLNQPVQYSSGVGPRVAEILARKGILTVGDLLFHLPYRYIDRRELSSIDRLVPGKDKTIVAQIISCGLGFMGRQRRKIYEMVLSDGTGRLTVKWFHVPKFMLSLYKRGMWVLVSGEASIYRKEMQFIHPDVEILDSEEAPFAEAPGILPLYPLTEGLSQRMMRKIILNSLTYAEEILECLPEKLTDRQSLLSLGESLKIIHNPSGQENLNKLNGFKTEAHKRLIFEEFFYISLGMAMKRMGVKKKKGIEFKKDGDLLRKFLKSLPFTLTGDQKQVLSEISKDMESAKPMNRLVQGDVGSGKTIVSLISALISIQNGYQAVIMAPTEILAKQHFVSCSTRFKSIGLDVCQITGSTSAADRKKILNKLKKGDLPIIIGTHALIEDAVQFHKLGLVIIDEQHRFGVIQRALLGKKGKHPDILVLTATPIPRTLAMTVYGDLDVSSIKELPPGRQPIETFVTHERDRTRLYNMIRDTVEQGEQIFVVYPLVQESEKLDLKDATNMSKRLEKEFPSSKIGLLHGKFSGEEKDAVMTSFKKGEVDVLVSTTVIEVGVDIPNATLMIVEHAERFGLAQLHQLRGRVGRGEKASRCVLMVGGGQSAESLSRLKVMAKTQDGFKIAEADLEIRGPGEMIGTKQAGLPDFHIANLLRDSALVEIAREEANRIVEEDSSLSKPENQALKEALLERWQGKLDLASVA